MEAQTLVSAATPHPDREEIADSNPRVVFLPFSETLLGSAPHNTSCWQRQTPASHSNSANYPLFNLAGDANTPALVPFDQEWMSLSILKHGRWEPLSS